jgi:hypothetical protein
MFNQPEKELDILNGLWVDTVAYTEHWRAYNATCIEEWKGVSLMVCLYWVIIQAQSTTNTLFAVFRDTSVRQTSDVTCKVTQFPISESV